MAEQKISRPVDPGPPAAKSDVAAMQSGRAIAQVVSTVVGRVGCEALDRVLENRGQLFEAFTLVWVCGTAAAGKSTATRHLHTAYPDIPVIHDRQFLMDEIQQRAEVHGAKSLPTIVDRDVLCSAFHRVAVTAERSPKAIIELGRGRSAIFGGHERVEDDPMSLSFALRELSPDVLVRSLFLYLSAPLTDRLSRNSERPLAENCEEELIPNVRCSDDTMHKVFQDVDAGALLNRTDLHFIELRNVVEREQFLELLELLFGETP